MNIKDARAELAQICLVNALLGVESEKTIRKLIRQSKTLDCDYNDVKFIKVHDTECLVIYDAKVSRLYIAFKWTEEDEISDVGAHLLTKAIKVQGIGKVHSGYYQKYKLIEHDLLAIIDRFVRRANKPVFEICVTGHSLGGALASIAYLALNNYLEEHFDENMCSMWCSTTGSCRSIKSTLMAKQDIQCINFVNFEDYITLYPLGYKHLGKVLIIKDKGKRITPNQGFLPRFRLGLCFIIEQVKNYFKKGQFFLIPNGHHLDEYAKSAGVVEKHKG